VTPRRVALAVAALAAAGLAVRIWFLADVTGDSSLVGDGVEYVGLADALADGRGYVSPFVESGGDPVPSAHKPPLYPLLLALVALFGATGHIPFQVISALVGTATVVVCALLAHRIAGRRAAILTAAIGAAYPVFVVADASLRAESLYGLCIALTLLAAYLAWERPTTWRLVALGAIIGLATLARSEGLALLVLIGVPIVLMRGSPGRAWRLAVLAGACALVLAPWLIRCWIVFDQPVLISTNSGDLIAGANCEDVYSGSRIGSWSFDCATGVSGDNEAEVASELRERGFDYARDHADRLPAVAAARALRPWGFFDPAGEVSAKTFGEGRSRTANWLGLAACWALLALAVVAFVVLRRRGQPLFILAAPFVLVVVVSVTSYGILRFRAPADVALVVLGGVALDALLGARRQAPRSAESATS
jgi:Dolichyl-phosphate-mannose-protein mannosyltransferase